MAYAEPRSCNDALYEGATEAGKTLYKPNRGGVVTSPSSADYDTYPMRETIRGRECC